MIELARELTLPTDAVTQTFALLGRRGSGKTNTAIVAAEGMLRSNYPIVVLDPLGVWWGLRSSADGKRAGFPIVIFGGDHQDVPLEPTGGKLVADFVVAERVPVILDLNGFGENDMRRFVADFAKQFYKINRQAIHWFVDEADEFAPQSPGGGPAAACLGAMQNIVRRGRARGIGVTLITQRSAVLNKSVLTQTECLIALQTTGPHDLRAIDDWFKYQGSPAERNEIMQSLPRLERGDAWVYSPSWLKLLKQVHIRARTTFDSSATPAPGAARRVPKRLADIDLGKVQKQMAATVEQAKANDPKELRRRIAELEKQNAALGKVKPAETIKRVEVPTVSESQLQRLEKHAERLGTLGRDLLAREKDLREALAKVSGAKQVAPTVAKQPEPPFVGSLRRGAGATRKPAAAGQKLDGLNGTQQRILDALLWYESIGNFEPSNIQVGAVAGLDATGGYFGNTVGPLATAGLIARGRGRIQLTEAGRAAAQPLQRPVTLERYHNLLRQRAQACRNGGGTTVRLLNAILDAGGAELTNEQLGQAAGIDHTGGYFGNSIGPLSTLGFIRRERGVVKPVVEVLFPELPTE